jgi:intron-binding protein aquarius
MNEEAIIPDWLHDIFLGYGDPGAALWHNLPGQLRTVDFKDTFLDVEHVERAFPQYKVGGGC